MSYLIDDTMNVNANVVQNAISKVYYYAKYGILNTETVEYYAKCIILLNLINFSVLQITKIEIHM